MGTIKLNTLTTKFNKKKGNQFIRPTLEMCRIKNN